MKTLLILAALMGGAQDSDEITTESLLREMVDLDRLTGPADYTCKQFSSYDRKSKTPENHNDWFANHDRGHYLRVEGGEHVLAEAEGPGAIVRIWSANPEGTIRIYLDGKVVLSKNFTRLTHGQVEPFTSPYGGMRARGCNLYFPFPYAKSMKVTTDKGDQYFHVNYRTYPKGTKVRTYTEPPVELMKEIAAKLTARGPCKEGSEHPFTGTIEISGPRTVTCLELTKIEGDLRNATIKMTFDGEMTVWSPLGDFFGTAPGENRYRTLPMGTWYCNWRMPFEKVAKIEIEGAEVEGVIRHRKGAAPLRFYAWWRGKARTKTRPMYDWPILHCEGKGRMLGCAVYTRNPVRHWWGEGDEKIFVDDETFPSTFGTGTEDYFGYAWCFTELFDHAYHSQSRCDGPGNAGSTAVNRFHVIDDIPFNKRMQFDMELWSWADCTMGYASIAYWYAEAGCKHDFKVLPDSERELLPAPKIKVVEGALEGENKDQIKVLRASGGVVEPQGVGNFGNDWSRDQHLWWRGAKVGDTAQLIFESGKKGPAKVFLAMTKAPDYGIVKISINRKVVAEDFDLYAQQVCATGEQEYAVELREGPNEILVEIVGTNPAAKPANYMFGLDYVRIE